MTAFGDTGCSAKVTEVITRIDPAIYRQFESFYYALDRFPGVYVPEEILSGTCGHPGVRHLSPEALYTFDVGGYAALRLHGTASDGRGANHLEVSEVFLFFVAGVWAHENYVEYELFPQCHASGHYMFSRILAKVRSGTDIEILCPKDGCVAYLQDKPAGAFLADPAGSSGSVCFKAQNFYNEVSWELEPCDSDSFWAGVPCY